METKPPIRDIRLEVIKREYARLKYAPGTKADKIEQAIIRTIEAGYWNPGDRIPTEVELARTFSASQGTVQNALRHLVSAGIIVRLRGSGSWIADFKEKGGIVWFLRFYQDNREAILDVSAEHIEIMETEEEGPWARFLQGRQSFININRIFTIGGNFRVLGRLFLASGRFRPLIDYAPNTFQSLHVHHILQDRFNFPTLNIEQNCRLVELDEAGASAIGASPGTIALEREIFSYTFHNDPLSYQIFIIPPNNYRMDILTFSPEFGPSKK